MRRRNKTRITPEKLILLAVVASLCALAAVNEDTCEKERGVGIIQCSSF